jgi:predicted MFS family arabinose efflux permease
MVVPLAVLVALGWALMLAVLIHGVRSCRRDLMVSVSALSVGILAVLYSLVDFSLQIPGYAIPCLALVGAGLAQSFASVRRQVRADPSNSQSTITGFQPGG